MYFCFIIKYSMIKKFKVDAEGSRNLDAGNQGSVLTIAQTARFLQVTLPTLYRWKKSKVLQPVKIVGRVYYRMQDIENLFNRG